MGVFSFFDGSKAAKIAQINSVVDGTIEKRGDPMHEMRKKKFRRGWSAFLAALLCISLSCAPAWAQEDERTLIPLGQTVGIKLFSDGVLVVSTSELESDGVSVSPAKDCGLKEGDLILRMNDEKVQSTEHVQDILRENGEAPVALQVRRGSKTMETSITPVHCEDDVYRMGAWIRDSMAGIGTLTYYDPVSGTYGALGHGITDVDTAKLMPLAAGSIMETTVQAVKKGEKGDPGELKGDFSVQRDVGTLQANTDEGIFGAVGDESFLCCEEALPVARRDQIHTGPATIRSTIAGDTVEEYEVEIEHIYPDSQTTRNMMVRVTDPRLLETTGGIVQGMSGSPIIQDGKLVGAVTHVLVNDPTKGYGIFIENMLGAET